MNVPVATSIRPSHLTLGVSDVEVSERFYRDTLGLPTVRVGDDIEVEWPGFRLILTHRPPATRAKFRFGFQADSASEVDAWAGHLRSSGVDIVSGPANNGSRRTAFFIDPDNYEIEIFCENGTV